MDTCYIWQWLKAPKPQSSAGLKPVQCWYRSKGFFCCCRETKSDINSHFAHISLCQPPRQLQIQLRQSTAALCSVYASLFKCVYECLFGCVFFSLCLSLSICSTLFFVPCLQMISNGIKCEHKRKAEIWTKRCIPFQQRGHLLSQLLKGPRWSKSKSKSKQSVTELLSHALIGNSCVQS